MRISAAEEDARLSGDLREHRRADMALRCGRGATSSRNWSIRSPCFATHSSTPSIDVLAAAPRQELDPQLLEIAREAGGQQPLPLVGGNEASDLLLRPIEAERFAEPGVGAGRFELVELVARSERGDAEHAVELVTGGPGRGRCRRLRRVRSAGRGGPPPRS